MNYLDGDTDRLQFHTVKLGRQLLNGSISAQADVVHNWTDLRMADEPRQMQSIQQLCADEGKIPSLTVLRMEEKSTRGRAVNFSSSASVICFDL
jgi:hypothetical protein